MARNQQILPKWSWSRLLAGALVVLGLSVVLTALVWYRQTPQDSRSQAQLPTNQVAVRLVPPSSTTVTSGQTATIDLQVQTAAKVSGLEIWGAVEGVPMAELQLAALAKPGLVPITQQLASTTTANTATFHLVWFSDVTAAELYTTHGQWVSIGQIKVKPTQARTLTVRLNTDTSQVVSFAVPDLMTQFQQATIQNLALRISTDNNGGQTPNPVADQASDTRTEAEKQADKKSCNQNCATDTECRSQFVCYKGRCRNPDDRENDQCGPPDQGLNRQCNQYCADTRECADGLSCYYNFCRHPQNLENTACQPPVRLSSTTATGSGNRSTAAKGGRSSTSQTRATASPTPTPTPRVTAEITIDSAKPTASDSATGSASQLDTPVATTPTQRLNRRVPVETTEPRPSLVPIPEEVQQQQNQGGSSAWIWIVGGLLVMVMGGLGAWWWIRQQE